jgi:hypothetical protein
LLGDDGLLEVDIAGLEIMNDDQVKQRNYAKAISSILNECNVSLKIVHVRSVVLSTHTTK